MMGEAKRKKKHAERLRAEATAKFIRMVEKDDFVPGLHHVTIDPDGKIVTKREHKLH